MEQMILMSRFPSASAYISAWQRHECRLSLLANFIGADLNKDGEKSRELVASAIKGISRCIEAQKVLLYRLSKLILYSRLHVATSRYADALAPSSPRFNFVFDFPDSLVNVSYWITWQAH